MQFNELMRSIEREEMQRELLKEWYRQRSLIKRARQNN